MKPMTTDVILFVIASIEPSLSGGQGRPRSAASDRSRRTHRECPGLVRVHGASPGLRAQRPPDTVDVLRVASAPFDSVDPLSPRVEAEDGRGPHGADETTARSK